MDKYPGFLASGVKQLKYVLYVPQTSVVEWSPSAHTSNLFLTVPIMALFFSLPHIPWLILVLLSEPKSSYTNLSLRTNFWGNAA